MRTPELIYFPGCPHVAEAREQLKRAFAEANLTPSWVEYQTEDPGLPEHARGFGSPTILVDGRDVTGAAAAGTSEACRLYVDAAGRQAGVPPLRDIVVALTATAAQLP
jgi:hypothetical protein